MRSLSTLSWWALNACRTAFAIGSCNAFINSDPTLSTVTFKLFELLFVANEVADVFEITCALNCVIVSVINWLAPPWIE